MINYYLSQKFKLLGNDDFKHLTIQDNKTLHMSVYTPLNKWGPTHEIFNFLNGR